MYVFGLQYYITICVFSSYETLKDRSHTCFQMVLRKARLLSSIGFKIMAITQHGTIHNSSNKMTLKRQITINQTFKKPKSLGDRTF